MRQVLHPLGMLLQHEICSSESTCTPALQVYYSVFDLDERYWVYNYNLFYRL